MRRVVIAGAVVAALMAAAPSAFAAERLQLLRETGQVLNSGEGVESTTAVIGLHSDAWCERIERGAVAGNEKATDKLTFGTVTFQECSPETTLGGVIKEVKLSTGGAYTLIAAGKLVFHTPGNCVYQLSRLTGTFTPEAAVQGVDHGTGKLNRKTSSAGCPAEESFEVISTPLTDEGEELKTRLLG